MPDVIKNLGVEPTNTMCAFKSKHWTDVNSQLKYRSLVRILSIEFFFLIKKTLLLSITFGSEICSQRRLESAGLPESNNRDEREESQASSGREDVRGFKFPTGKIQNLSLATERRTVTPNLDVLNSTPTLMKINEQN